MWEGGEHRAPWTWNSEEPPNQWYHFGWGPPVPSRPLDIVDSVHPLATPLGSSIYFPLGMRCSSVVRAFAHGAKGRRIDPSWAISRSS